MARLFLDQDPLKSILRNLPGSEKVRLEDIQTTRTAVRWLATRAPVGTLGPKDRPDVRAAVLLDYVVSSSGGSPEDQQKKTWGTKDLARAACLKPNNFKKIHAAIGHYYHDFRSSGQKQAVSAASNTSSSARETQKRTTTSTTSETTTASLSRSAKRSRRGELPQNLFPSLAIRLASHLSDPNGTARRATIFFHEMYAHAMDSLPTVVDKRGQEHDFRRYWAAYQAAVLFTLTSSDAVANTRQQRDEEAAVRPLKLEDLVRASPDCTYMELREKLPCVEKWAQEMRAKSAVRPVAVARRDHTMENDGSINPEVSATERTNNDDATSDDAVDYVEWKESILTRVLERTQTKAPHVNDRSSLLQMAADAVLAKHGVSPDFVVEENGTRERI